MNEINYILVDNLGLATYRFVLANGAVGEFVDLEEGVRLAAERMFTENDAVKVGVAFPDGDVQWRPPATEESAHP